MTVPLEISCNHQLNPWIPDPTARSADCRPKYLSQATAQLHAPSVHLAGCTPSIIRASPPPFYLQGKVVSIQATEIPYSTLPPQ